MTQEIAISDSYGGTTPSKKVLKEIHDSVDDEFVWIEDIHPVVGFEDGERILADETIESYKCEDIPRDHPVLVEAIRELEKTGWKVVEIPDDVEWIVDEYDGKEWVAEQHETWPDQWEYGNRPTGPNQIE